MGYSADELEQIIRSIDWDIIISNRVSFESISFEEKEYYNRYVIEELKRLTDHLSHVERACEQDARIAELEKKASDAEELLKTRIRMTASRMGTVEDLLTDAFVALKSGDANLRYVTSLKIAEYFKDNPRFINSCATKETSTLMD